MSGSITWVGAYLVLCRLLQMVLELSNQQFILLFLIGTALIFIVTSLTHTHDIDAEEVALKGVETVEQKVTEIVIGDSEDNADSSQQVGASGHRAPQGF